MSPGLFHLTRRAREECATLAIDGGWGGGAVEEGGGGNRAPQHGLPLSLSTSGEDFAPLWRALKDSLWTEATGAKNTWSTCSTTVSCFANTVQGSLIFFTISYKEHG